MVADRMWKFNPDRGSVCRCFWTERPGADTRYRERQLVSGKRVLVTFQFSTRGGVAGGPGAPCSVSPLI